MLVGDIYTLLLLLGLLSLPLAALFGRKPSAKDRGPLPSRPRYYHWYFWVSVFGFGLSFLAALTIINVFYDSYADAHPDRPFNDVDLASRFIVVWFLVFVINWLAGLVADQAVRKGRSWAAFYWLSIFVTPLLTWLVVATLAEKQGATTTTNPLQEDVAKSLSNLAALRESGDLTDEEFSAAKKKLLE